MLDFNRYCIMKKIFFAAALIISAFAISCTKENAPVQDGLSGPKFSFVGVSTATKTAMSGLNDIVWQENDEVNLFHAAAGTTAYVNDNNFKTDAVVAGAGCKFTGTLAGELSDAAYDWYAVYPYDSHFATPGPKESGHLAISSTSGVAQSGSDPMAHLAGPNMPLYAISKNVAAAEEPVLTFSNMASVIKLNITNGTSAPVTIQQVNFVAPEAVVGTFFIDITGEELAYVPSKAAYVSNTSKVMCTDFAATPANGTVAVYIPVKPFTAAAGQELTIKVSTDEGNCEKTVTLASAFTALAGHIKTVSFNLEIAEEDPNADWRVVTDTAELSDGDIIVITNEDANQAIGVYTTGSNIKAVAATPADGYQNVAGVGLITLGVVDGGYTFSTETGYLYAPGGTKNNYLKTTNSSSTAGAEWSITFKGKNAVIKAKISDDGARNWMRYNPNNGVPIFNCYNNGQQDVRIYKFYGVVLPVIIAEDFSVSYTETTKALSEIYSISNPYSGATMNAVVLGNPTWCRISDGNLCVDANAEQDSRTASIKFTYSAPDNAYEPIEKTITVTQDGAPASGSPRTLFLETFGSITSNVVITSATSLTATTDMFVNNVVADNYSGVGKVGKNSVDVSSGYEGVSGGSAIWYQATKNTTNSLLKISNINIAGATNIVLSFGKYFKDGASDTNKLSVKYSIDGGEVTTVPVSYVLKTTWTLDTVNIEGTGTYIDIEFEHTVTGGFTVRLDDIQIVGTK